MDYEKTIQFLLEHHARFSADIEELKEEDKRLGQRIQQVSSNLDRVVTVVSTLAEVAQGFQAGLDELREQMKETDRRMKENAERMRETDERLNALISIVDGIVRRNPPA